MIHSFRLFLWRLFKSTTTQSEADDLFIRSRRLSKSEGRSPEGNYQRGITGGDYLEEITGGKSAVGVHLDPTQRPSQHSTYTV